MTPSVPAEVTAGFTVLRSHLEPQYDTPRIIRKRSITRGPIRSRRKAVRWDQKDLFRPSAEAAALGAHTWSKYVEARYPRPISEGLAKAPCGEVLPCSFVERPSRKWPAVSSFCRPSDALPTKAEPRAHPATAQRPAPAETAAEAMGGPAARRGEAAGPRAGARQPAAAARRSIQPVEAGARWTAGPTALTPTRAMDAA